MCFAVAIVINKLSHLSDCVCNFVGGPAAESTKFISVMSFGRELDKRRERSESRSFRFKWKLPSSVSLSQRIPGNRKVFRIGLHATASKPSPPRKALFSSMQEQSQHQPKDNVLRDI
jgi:hypothetical protein